MYVLTITRWFTLVYKSQLNSGSLQKSIHIHKKIPARKMRFFSAKDITSRKTLQLLKSLTTSWMMMWCLPCCGKSKMASLLFFIFSFRFVFRLVWLISGIWKETTCLGRVPKWTVFHLPKLTSGFTKEELWIQLWVHSSIEGLPRWLWFERRRSLATQTSRTWRNPSGFGASQAFRFSEVMASHDSEKWNEKW